MGRQLGFLKQGWQNASPKKTGVRKMKKMEKKVTIASQYGLVRNVTFRIIHETEVGYYVSYLAAKKARRNNSGDYYPGLIVFFPWDVCDGKPYAFIEKASAKIVK